MMAGGFMVFVAQQMMEFLASAAPHEPSFIALKYFATLKISFNFVSCIFKKKTLHTISSIGKFKFSFYSIV
jgi:hypothetical protein